MTEPPTSATAAVGPPGAGRLSFGVLGPVEVRRDGLPVKVGGPKVKAVLAMLVLEANRVVSTARLIEGVWGEDPPVGVQATLQVHVSNLRKVLGADVVVTRAPGYLLQADPEEIDLACFEADLFAARATVDAAEARTRLASALARWRGPALADVLDAPFATSAVPWLVERRSLAVEEHAEQSLAMGAHRDVVGELESALREAPHRERLWGQLMVALYRSGRQADALGAYQRARHILADDLGIDPGPELRRLEGLVLAQDPSLDLAAPRAGGAGRPVPGPRGGDDSDATVRAPLQAGCRLVFDDGRELTLEGPVAIGRHEDCEITLADVGVSRRHAEVRPALGGYLLVDLGSTNGTLVNDAPVVQHFLVDGDVIRIGAHHLRYRIGPT